MAKYSELDWQTVREHLRSLTTEMDEVERFPARNVRVLGRGIELVMQRLEELGSAQPSRG